MNKKTFILPIAVLSGLLSLVGCGNSDVVRTDNEIYVTVYDGGYGTAWIDQVAKDYEAKTGVHVNWNADQSILDRMTSELDNPQSDIYMSHDITWQEYAELGQLEQLDDLYNSQVEGTGKTFKQRLCAGAEEVSRLEDGHYYKVCYTQGAGGLVYNVDMFREYSWSVPTTYEELKTLCQTIVNRRIVTEDRELVVPIAWSGKDREYYWDYIVFEWWAQLGGIDAINKYKAFLGDDGKYSTGYQVYNPATNHKEFKQAYEK
ncbi:MAG: carbohydrate ABC transporter substrate-binding protein [Bacilli bacterium]|nr:carbohydrate ABC transporter substrate-binding protein [Bacilli bacterium]